MDSLLLRSQRLCAVSSIFKSRGSHSYCITRQHSKTLECRNWRIDSLFSRPHQLCVVSSIFERWGSHSHCIARQHSKTLECRNWTIQPESWTLYIWASFVARSFFDTPASPGWMTSHTNCFLPSKGFCLNLRVRMVKSDMMK